MASQRRAGFVPAYPKIAKDSKVVTFCRNKHTVYNRPCRQINDVHARILYMHGQLKPKHFRFETPEEKYRKQAELRQQCDVKGRAWKTRYCWS